MKTSDLNLNYKTAMPKGAGGDIGCIVRNEAEDKSYLLKQAKAPAEPIIKDKANMTEQEVYDLAVFNEFPKTRITTMLDESIGSQLYSAFSDGLYETNKVMLLSDGQKSIDLHDKEGKQITGQNNQKKQVQFVDGKQVCVEMNKGFNVFSRDDGAAQDLGKDNLNYTSHSQYTNGLNIPYINNDGKVMFDILRDENKDIVLNGKTGKKGGITTPPHTIGGKPAAGELVTDSIEIQGYVAMLAVAKALGDFDCIGYGGNAGFSMDSRGNATLIKIDTGKLLDREKGQPDRDKNGRWKSNHSSVEMDLANKNLLNAMPVLPGLRTDNVDTSISYEKLKEHPKLYDEFAMTIGRIANAAPEDLRKIVEKGVPKGFGGNEVNTDQYISDTVQGLTNRQTQIKQLYPDEIAHAAKLSVEAAKKAAFEKAYDNFSARQRASSPKISDDGIRKEWVDSMKSNKIGLNEMVKRHTPEPEKENALHKSQSSNISVSSNQAKPHDEIKESKTAPELKRASFMKKAISKLNVGGKIPSNEKDNHQSQSSDTVIKRESNVRFAEDSLSSSSKSGISNDRIDLKDAEKTIKVADKTKDAKQEKDGLVKSAVSKSTLKPKDEKDSQKDNEKDKGKGKEKESKKKDNSSHSRF
jgi:hypothetical protein